MMKIAFIDEDGLLSNTTQNDAFDWVILNTRETVHRQDRLSSGNVFVLLRFFFLKRQELREKFPWNRIQFHWKSQRFLSVGCVFKTRDREIEKKLYNGVISFEEMMKVHIQSFVGENFANLQIAFVFSNGWIRSLVLEGGEILSSRLTSLKASTELVADFIICDEEIKARFNKSISSEEFSHKLGYRASSLKELILSDSFLKIKDLLIPLAAPDFKASIGSFYGKKQALRQLLITVVLFIVGLFYQASNREILSQNELMLDSNETLKEQVQTDPVLKRKKAFAHLFLEKEMDFPESPLRRIKALSILQAHGFYAQVIHWERSLSESLKIVVKPLHTRDPRETLSQFSLLEKNLKKLFVGGDLVVHKVPLGLEKIKGKMQKLLKNKPSSCGKIAVLWDKKR